MGKEIYLGNPLLKAVNVKMEYTPEQAEEYIKCANDPEYFIEKYIKVVSLDEGLSEFKMYPFQKEIVKSFHNNRFTICKIPRQSGKSTTVSSYILHYVIFNPNVRVGILANKGNTAKELLDRLKTSYENLPKWLQQGVAEWNKFSILLENGSKIISAATSSSAVRGGSYNILILDEFAYVPNNVAEEFFSSVYPTITSGKTTKLMIISTPKGMNHFFKIWQDAIQGRNGYKPIEAHWYDVPGRDAKFKRDTIANTSEQQWRVEFECDFVGSENTLLSAQKLASMAFLNPLVSLSDGFDVYEHPVPGKIYTICVDTSHGVEMDYHAFTVIDCSQMPYRIVAKFRNNAMSPQVYPAYIKKIATSYNEAYVLFELNDIGASVANMLHDELEYGNFIHITNRGKKGQSADGGFGGAGKVTNGVNMSYAIKKLGCTLLKEMIESDKLLIQDFHIISELSTFCAHKSSFEATEGYKDDLVMTLVQFAWLTTQSFFKDYTNTDVRRRLYEEKLRLIEDNVMPFGFVADGGPEEDGSEEFQSGDDFWSPVTKADHLRKPGEFKW
jgi:hypothetical protein